MLPPDGPQGKGVRGTAPPVRSARPAPDLSVVIPARDEAENVAPLAADVEAALGGKLDYELIFVDDGSVDATPSALSELARTSPRVRWVRHSAPCGQSAAIWTGVRIARAPWIVTLDGDGQNDPADIPGLIAARDARGTSASRANLLVNGRRARRRDSWVKRTSSRIANFVRRRVLGDDTTDTGCGLKLFPRETFLALPFFDHMHRFLPALVRRNGGEVVSVPVHHRERLHGRSHYGVHNRLWTGVVDLLGVLWLQRRARLPVLALPPPAAAPGEAAEPEPSKESK